MMSSHSSFIRQQQRFILWRRGKRQFRRLTVEAWFDPSLRWKWIGLFWGLVLAFLMFPSSLDRVPVPLPQDRHIAPEAPSEPAPEPTSVFDPFPFPDALEPQVSFWRDIFTRYTTDHLVIHDSWYLPVVYEVVDIASSEFTSKAAGKQAAKAAQKKYEEVLETLAQKWDDPDSMTATERQLYDMFQKYPNSDRFPQQDAKDRVRIQVGQADRVREGLIRAGRYFDAMKQILRDHDLPESFVYLPIVESGFNTQAESHLGATGMWQFMRSTGKQYDLKIDAYMDERRDPLKATTAAAQLLSYNYEKIESWPLAITAYNHGLQGMFNAVKAVGSAEIDVIIEEYSGSRFKFASRNFYPEFLAAVDVGTRYLEYFGELDLEAPLPLTQITLDHYVLASTLEKYTPLTAADIKELNPAIHSSAFNSGNYVPKGASLNIPVQHAAAFATAYAAIPDTLKLQAITVRHRVRKGETLSTIAQKYGTRTTTLANLNNISNPSKIRIGQVLEVPGRVAASSSENDDTPSSKPSASTSTASGPATITHTVQKGHTLTAIAQRYGTTVSALTSLNNIKNPASIRPGQRLQIPAASQASTGPAIHRVRKGQTLTSIAKQYNTSVHALSSLNNISNPRSIQPGQLLKIPRG